MQSSDDKHYPLTKTKRSPQPRHAVSKKEFSLPKPYRRQLFSEEPERLTRLQMGILAFAALMITTLLGVLALLAHENDLSPEGKLIVAAAELEAVESAEAQIASLASPPPPTEAPIPPALQHGVRSGVPEHAAKRPSPARTRLAPKPKDKGKEKAKPAIRLASAPNKVAPKLRAASALLAREKNPKPPRKEPAVTVPAPDPDVALIAAILLLTPAPAPASVAMELAGRAHASCAPTMPKDPTCAEAIKLKP